MKIIHLARTVCINVAIVLTTVPVIPWMVPAKMVAHPGGCLATAQKVNAIYISLAKIYLSSHTFFYSLFSLFTDLQNQ